MTDIKPQGINSYRITDMGGLLTFVPALVGFPPERSIVVMFLAGNRVALTMRADYAEANLHQLLVMALRAADQSSADELVIAVYMPEITQQVRSRACDLAVGLETQTMDADRPLRVLGLAAVGDDGWCELDAWDPQIPTLRPLAELEDHVMRVQHIYDGKAVASSREEIAARVKPSSDPHSHELVVAADAMIHRVRDMSAAEAEQVMAEHLDDIEKQPMGHPLDDRTKGQLMALLAHPAARDVAMLRLDRENARTYVPVWSQVVRVAGGRVACAALFLVGVAGWQLGDGALMNCCLDEARAIDPQHVGVAVMGMVTTACLPPDLFDELKHDLREATA